MNFTTFSKLTRLEQSLFGLPFVLAGFLLPFITRTLSFQFQLSWIWIIPAFFAARFSGMAFNQAIDRQIDAENQRTHKRVVASGLLQSKSAFTLAFAFLMIFLLCCSQINKMTFTLALLATLLLVSYSYTKRVTCLCHFILGVVHFLAPVMAWVAVVGTIAIPPLLLGCMNMMLIVGVDMIYALQDLEFDLKRGLHSIPVKLGIRGAQRLAQLVHFLGWIALLLLALVCNLTALFYLAILIIATIFYLFHRRVNQAILGRSLQRVEPLFFYCTISVSLTTFLFLLLEI